MRHFLIALVLLTIHAVRGSIVLPSYFSSSMVLQQNEDVEFWGVSSPQQHITVNFDDKSFETTTDDSGKFQVVLPGRAAGLKAYTIAVQERGGGLCPHPARRCLWRSQIFGVIFVTVNFQQKWIS